MKVNLLTKTIIGLSAVGAVYLLVQKKRNAMADEALVTV